MAQSWDAIVIGSGIGGMSVAALLAKASGMRILVLEKHYERGGLTHVFRRDGASWDVGVHYVGDMGKGSVRALFDFMSNGKLEWTRICDDFERLIYPGLDFAVPSNQETYKARLIDRYPEEATGIRRYFADLKAVSDWYSVSTLREAFPRPVSSVMSLLRLRNKHKALQTTKEYLDSHFKSPELKSLLASQWSDYGMPPAESAFALHALVMQSFADGGWFPKGGSSRIARTFETSVEASGGAVKVGTDVTGILTDENGRVTGVKAIDHCGVEPTEVTYKAPIVISNAGAELTYTRLLPMHGRIGQSTAAVRAVVDRLKGGLSAVTLYVRLHESASTIGIKGENFWINTTLDHDDIHGQTADTLAGKPRHVFMSFPSLKTSDERFHTAEVLTLVSGDAFSTWRETKHGDRGQAYLDLKDRISKGLLDVAESAAPGFKQLVRYAELSTPISVEDYTSRAAGEIYGLKGSPERYRSSELSAISPIPGLYLSGGDVFSLGVAGALMGGVLAAGCVLGPLGFLRIMRAAQNVAPTKAEVSDAAKSSDKKRAVVVSKTKLSPTIYMVEFEVDESIAFAPGQYAMLCVAPFEWRSYSIVSARCNCFALLVSTSTGGDGSLFIKACKTGSETQVELPFGGFRLRGNSHRKVFVATGTGLAPFLPMFLTLKDNGTLGLAELLFGVRLVKDDISRDMSPLPQTTICASGDASAEEVFHGRVTQALESLTFDPAITDFYICGSPAMINDCCSFLVRAGAKNVFIESY